jgi:predicted nucleic acid-binding protein
MNNRIPRIYVETSVIGGMFDTGDHPEKTKPFWDSVQNGSVMIIISDVVEREIALAPEHVREFFDALPKSQIERVVSTDESDDLAEQYIAAKIVDAESLNDCRHIALASISGADVLVSWNCKHIVKLNRIRRYNAINKLLGYPEIEIRTPYEVGND